MCGFCRTKHKPIIGLAGGIGAGKSSVASILTELGVGLIDSDAISRAQMSGPEVAETLSRWWGDRVLDEHGGIDRKRVGDIVFEDSAERMRLEQLLHPRVVRERTALVERYEADPAIRAIVLDSPLLFETGLDKQCDVVWFVEAEQEVRAERVATSRRWSPEELGRREKLQKPLDFKRANADYRVVNSSGIDDLRPQVVHLLNQALERAPHLNS